MKLKIFGCGSKYLVNHTKFQITFSPIVELYNNIPDALINS